MSKQLKAGEILQRAEANAQERLFLINEMLGLVYHDEDLQARIRKVDTNFLRKLWGFPGDLTTHRIATVISKTLK